MDTLTQMALGATIGAAGFGHRLGRKGVVFGGLCGLLPDLDFVLAVGDAWASLVVHRGASHSLLVLPLVAIPLGWLAWWLAKRRDSPWRWVHLAVWGLVTHPLLDLCTAYGTQLFAPLTRSRYAIDAVAILDPVYSIPLFVVSVMALRARRPWPQLRRISTIALALTTAYLAAGYVQSRLAISRAEAAIAQLAPGFEPVSVRANPTMFNTMLFRVVARDAAGNVLIGTSSTLGGAPTALLRYDWPGDDPLVARALESAQGQIFSWFTDGYLRATVEPLKGGYTLVQLDDMRYGSISEPSQPVFGAEFVFDAQGELMLARRVNQRDVDVGVELSALGAGILGEHPQLEGGAHGTVLTR